ncbi:MAG TPA: hypothetical protein VFP94_04295 [Terriglobales bacterium]|nr:hypothetical protein [Terriglobales bacterium]
MLLTEIELRAALEPLLDRLLTERLRLFRLELEPRLQSLIHAGLEPRSASELQAGLERMRAAEGLGNCFSALFEVAEPWIGRQRALLVVRREQVAVWKNFGMNLPARFDIARREEVLRGGSQAEVRVRGQLVGLLHWPESELSEATRSRLELFTRWAGLLLLEQGLGKHAAAARGVLKEAAEVPQAAPSPARAAAGSPAEHFAELLIEDLRLYLQRERAEELAAGRASGDWRVRFAPELERCRRAFGDRFGSVDVIKTFEGATPRLVD